MSFSIFIPITLFFLSYYTGGLYRYFMTLPQNNDETLSKVKNLFINRYGYGYPVSSLAENFVDAESPCIPIMYWLYDDKKTKILLCKSKKQDK